MLIGQKFANFFIILLYTAYFLRSLNEFLSINRNKIDPVLKWRDIADEKLITYDNVKQIESR